MQSLDSILGINGNLNTLLQLRDELRRGRVVPFVGAGMSIPCGLPGWTNFLRDLANTANISEKVNFQIDSGEFEEAAQSVSESLGDAFSQEITRTFGNSEYSNIVGPVLKVPQLTTGPVLTTNFDRVLELVFAEEQLSFPNEVWGARVRDISDAIHYDRPYLVKIHGDHSDSVDRVLTADEYDRHYGNHSQWQTNQAKTLPKLLMDICTSRPLLFLGCSLLQDRTINLLKWVKASRKALPDHFALMEYPKSKSEYKSRVKLFESARIKPIWYPNGDYNAIETLLDLALTPCERGKQVFWFSDYSHSDKTIEKPNKETPETIAIDFGTTHTYAGWLENQKLSLVRPDVNSSPRIPSIVGFESPFSYVIGHSALAERFSSDLVIAKNAKRYFNDPKSWKVGRRYYSSKDVAVLILRKIRQSLESSFGTLPNVIASVPANFSTAQKRIFRNAILEAGFPAVLRMVAEPCAAALCCSVLIEENKDLLAIIVDVGGGTTDLALVDLVMLDDDLQAEVIGSVGDNKLGGMDFDSKLAECVHEELESLSTTVSGSINTTLLDSQIEDLKFQLTSTTTARIWLEESCADGSTRIHALEITREDYANKCHELTTQFRQLLDELKRKTISLGYWEHDKWDKENVIVLAGLGARTPPLLNCLNDWIEKANSPFKVIHDHGENAVIKGLAIQAGIMSGAVNNALLLDVIYRGLYLLCEHALIVDKNESDSDSDARIATTNELDEHRLKDIIKQTLIGSISGRENINSISIPVLYQGTTIPTIRSSYVRFEKSGRMNIMLAEGNHNGSSLEEFGTISLPVSEPGMEFELIFDVDANQSKSMTVQNSDGVIDRFTISGQVPFHHFINEKNKG